MSWIKTLLLIAFVLASGALRPADVPGVPATLIHTLSLTNGLRALLIERREMPLVCVEVWYHVGSKDERPGRTGFAHLFEHLMFDGTRNIGPELFSNYIIRSGGEDNAYTTEDATVFWETIPRTYLPVALWLEADRMRNLDITEKTFKNEKEVVEEERRLRFDNRPYGTVIETLYRHAFTQHPYRHSTIGSMEDLDHASVRDVRDFYNTYYVPDNATLVVAGDFNRAEAEELIRKDFGPLARGAHPIERGIPAEPPQQERRVLKIDRDVTLPAFVEGYHMPADGTPEAYPLRLASKILSDGESSRIYRRLVYDRQLAVDAESSGNFTEDPNLFFAFAVMNPGHAPAEGEAEVEAELNRLKTQLVSREELDKAKNQILRDFVVDRETLKGHADELGYAAVILKDPDLINMEPQRFFTVTAEDIQRVARKYFTAQNVTVVEVYPQGSSQTKQAERGRRLIPTSAPGARP